MTNTANTNPTTTVERNPAPHPAYVPTSKPGGLKTEDRPILGSDGSEEEKDVERVADEVAHKAAETEQSFDEENSKPFSK
jgi:hypothetical protein